MVPDQDVTLGEVYRRLEAMDERHGGALDRIDEHLSTLNSKVANHEKLHAEVGVKLRNVERELFGAKREREAAREADASRKDGIVVAIPTDGKTIMALLLALGALVAAIAKAWGA